MVDFSDREGVKRWLDEIKPERHRRQVAVAISARAALRVTPFFDVPAGDARATARNLSQVVLPNLRAAALSWNVVKHPDNGDQLRAAALAAQEDAQTAVVSGLFSVSASGVATFAARIVAHAIAVSNSSLAANAYAVSRITAALIENFVSGIVATVGDRAAAEAAIAAFASDVELIESGLSAAQLVGLPLWPNGAPDWASDAWRALKTSLLDANEGWDVWTDWYEARLAGDATQPPNEALEIARATIQDEIWKQGPAVVNAEINRLIAKYERGLSNSGEADREVSAPDISTEDQPEFEPILATRAVLRILPFLATDGRQGNSTKSIFTLSVFHALAVAWATTQYSSSVSANWSTAAARDIEPYGPGAGSAAHHVGIAAAAAAFSAGSAIARAAQANAFRAESQVIEAARAFRRGAAENIIKITNSSDVSDVAPGVSPSQIAQIALWPGRDPPEFMSDLWEFLKEGLRSADEGWEVWIDWYEARLDGRVRPQEVELAYINFIRNVSPIVSAKAANEEIRRLIELHAPSSSLPIGDTQPTAAGAAPVAVSSASGSISLEILSAPSIESIPTQDRTGTRFGIDAEGRIDIVRIPLTADESQRFLYDEMRHKARALADLGQMLGDLAQPTNRILEALPARMEDASVDKLWSRANTLRRRHDAHVRSVETNLGPDPARLDTLVAANLGDLVDSFNVYAVGDPRLLELDRIRLGPQDREAARKIVALAAPIALGVIEPHSPATLDAQEALNDQVGGAIGAPNDINGDQAVELARKTTGNFVSELLRIAYAPIRKTGAFVANGVKAAGKGMFDGFFQAAGAAAFGGVAAYVYWPEIVSFVVRHADALKLFVEAAYHNPKLIEIIDLIVGAAGHLS